MKTDAQKRDQMKRDIDEARSNHNAAKAAYTMAARNPGGYTKAERTEIAEHLEYCGSRLAFLVGWGKSYGIGL